MLKEHEAISDAIQKIEREIEKIEKAVLKNNENKLSALLFDFSKKIKKLTRNKFYEVFVYPMNTLRIELLALSLEKTAREDNIFKKGKEALKGYKQFIAEVKSIIIEIELQFQEFSEIILSYENQESPEK
jgi:DNA-binding GntR family transcriptional regulator